MGTQPVPILVLLRAPRQRPARRPRSRPARSTRWARTTSTCATRPARQEPRSGTGCVVLSRARVIRHPRARLGTRRAARPARRASVVGVCASAGGPQVLASLLGALPADYPIPILVVQHIAAGFTEGLVHWLDQAVRAAGRRRGAPGAGPCPGVWLAPKVRTCCSAPPGGCHSTGTPPPGTTARPATCCSPASPRRPGSAGVARRADRHGPRRCGRGGRRAAARRPRDRAGRAVLGGVRDAEGGDRARGRDGPAARPDRCLPAGTAPPAGGGQPVSPALAGLADLVRGTPASCCHGPGRSAPRRVDRAAPGLVPDASCGSRRTRPRPRSAGPADRRGHARRRASPGTARSSTQIAWPGSSGGPRGGLGTIRVWSAGCATGEEAYTLALLADQAFAPARAPVHVLGTDISGARWPPRKPAGTGERAVRALEPTAQPHLNRQADGSYLVCDRLRRLGRFRQHNLARDPVPPAGEACFDLIICSNVLIYFESPLARQVIEHLRDRCGQAACSCSVPLMRSSGRRPRRAGPRRARTPGPPVPGRRLPASAPPLTRDQRLAAALDAADNGDRDGALLHVTSLLADGPLDADAHFIHGLVCARGGRAGESRGRAAPCALRRLPRLPRGVHPRPCLRRAGRRPAARRAYEQALRTLDPQTTGTTGCCSRSTSATSPRRAGPGSAARAGSLISSPRVVPGREYLSWLLVTLCDDPDSARDEEHRSG